MGCGGKEQEPVKEPQKQSSEQKQEDKLEKDKEKYAYILDRNKSYQELNDEEQGVNYLYMDKLINGDAEYDSKYAERAQELTTQKQEKDDKRNAEKKEKMDAEFAHVKVAEDKNAALEEVKTDILKKLESTNYAGKYKLIVINSSATIEFNDNVKKSDVVKGELTSIARSVYDYYTEAGLARTETEVKPLSVYFKIEGEKFTSKWTLGKSPEDDWN